MEKIKIRIKADRGDIICCCLAATQMRCGSDCEIAHAFIDDRKDAAWCMSHNREVKLHE